MTQDQAVGREGGADERHAREGALGEEAAGGIDDEETAVADEAEGVEFSGRDGDAAEGFDGVEEESGNLRDGGHAAIARRTAGCGKAKAAPGGAPGLLAGGTDGDFVGGRGFRAAAMVGGAQQAEAGAFDAGGREADEALLGGDANEFAPVLDAATAPLIADPSTALTPEQFKEQLTSLVSSVEKTDPHYIRCLKPNDAARPKMLTRKRLTEQLRYGGVLEAVRVARAGYPVRMIHTEFFQRYRMLLPAVPDDVLPWSFNDADAQKLCIKLVDECLADGAKHAGKTLDSKEEGISRFEKIRRMQHQPIPLSFPKTDVQLGMTKVFMRKPPHDALEAHRVFHQSASATLIQTWVRGLTKRKQFYILVDAVSTVQRCYRGYKGRARYDVIVVYPLVACCVAVSHRIMLISDGMNCEKHRQRCFSQITSECRSVGANMFVLSVGPPNSRPPFEAIRPGAYWPQSRFKLSSVCILADRIISR